MQIFQLTMFILFLHLPFFALHTALSNLNKNLFDVAMAKNAYKNKNCVRIEQAMARESEKSVLVNE
jgi:hypothetical protein